MASGGVTGDRTIDYDAARARSERLDEFLASIDPSRGPVLRYIATGVPGLPWQYLPSGKYALVVQVGWPDPTGGKADGVYGFVLQVP